MTHIAVIWDVKPHIIFWIRYRVMNNYKIFLNHLTDDEPEPESEPGKYLINILTSNSQNFIIFTALTNEEYAA